MVSSMKKKLLSTSLTVALAITVAGCSTGNGNGEPTASPQATGDSKPAATAEGAKTPDPVTLKVMLFGEKPIGFDAVLDEFYKQTKDTLNTTLDVEWSPAADHREKVKLRMAAGEKVDLLFDAPWMNMNTFRWMTISITMNIPA
jgi:putative aldouronate transport system substrate-binding protein